jgi:hypothetical protein
VLFRLGRGRPAGISIGLFGFSESGLLLDLRCRRQQVVDIVGQGYPS